MRPLVFLVALSVVVILGVLVYPYLNRAQTPLSQEQAVAFVLDDVRPLESQGIQSRVVQVRSQGSQWAVDVLLTRNGHSVCPVVDKRFYTLPPVGYRSEPLLSTCSPSVSINYREEALIASAKLLPSLGADAFGCAFLAGSVSSNSAPDYASALTYCPQADFNALASFASDLPPQSWAVVWLDASSARYVAVSSSGKNVKSA